MTEAMRRELEVAISIAKSRGIDYGQATEEQRSACHKIAQAALPAVHRLIINAEVNARQEMQGELDKTYRESSRKAYEDGFEDGQKNDYNNRWASKEKSWDMDSLLG